MKLCVKKIYCPTCKQAVRAREQYGNGQDWISCSKCGRTIRVGNGIYWRAATGSEIVPGSQAGSTKVVEAAKKKTRKAR